MKNKLIIWGKVKKGQQRGKKLGFPTANIPLHRKIPEGIYVSETRIEQKNYPSVTFIGAAKTFKENDVKAETYMLDFDKNIYGKWISVKLLEKIRGNKTFSSVEKLREQMEKDVVQVKNFFAYRSLKLSF